MLTPTAVGLLCAVVTCVTWGVADYFAARISRQVGEIAALLRIQLVGAPVLVLAWIALRPPWPATADLLWIAAAAACFLVGYVSFFYGLRVGAISLVSPISSAGAVVPAFVGIALLGEAASGVRMGGMAVALLGVMVLTADPAAIGSLAREGRRSGIKAGIVTLVAWGSGTALLLPAIRSVGAFAPIAILRLEILTLLAAWWLVQRATADTASPGGALPPDVPFAGGWAVVVAASLLDLTAFFSYGVALRDAPAAVAAPIASGYPLVTILIARHRLHERLSPREWLGVGLTLAGAAVLGASCCDQP
ncbi:MAG TPA: DMT family transporter [Nitrospiria bacterium]|nr:DMT family transporter [Nitrospiria bacterium]